MISIKVPPLGESIVEATISRWLKAEGDAVVAGETLVELETDKVTVEVPATKTGVLVRRVHQEGDVVKVDEPLAELDERSAGAAGASAATGTARHGTTATESASVNAARPDLSRNEAVRSSPGARRVAAESGVDLRSVPGTGRAGVVSKPDVLDYVARGDGVPTLSVRQPESPSVSAAEPPPPGIPTPKPPETPPPAPEPPRPKPDVGLVRPEPPRQAAPPQTRESALQTAPSTRETRERMSTRRKRIAEHLLEAQHATAHLTTFNEIDMSAVEALRTRLRDRIEKEHGVRLTFMPFFVKAACMALKQYPMVNAQVGEDEIIYHHYVNMGIAVASDAGLVVPNLKDADSKGMIQIAREISELAKTARDGRLTMDDLTGGTFTITNGGVFGSLVSTPIINYPQVGILGLHKIQDRPVVVNGQIQVRPMMYVALSYDHRIIDGQHAVLFLVRVKELMEEPALMAVD